MLIGIVGLGLIGGSFAKAYSAAGHTVMASDIDASVLKYAMLSGAVDKELSDGILPECDLILICTYPQAALTFLEEKGALIGGKPIVMDCCGTKRHIVEKGRLLAKQYGFTYVGGHPMAGTQYSGFKYAKETMFQKAPMVIVPPDYDDVFLLKRIKELLSPVGFSRITVTTAEVHDEMIAYTSQLAHIVSSAYIKNPTARRHKGFSAGSYKDMTRVAWLNPEMWTQLCMDNRDNLLKEIDVLIQNLNEYKAAFENADRDTLLRLLAEGRAIKEEVDG